MKRSSSSRYLGARFNYQLQDDCIVFTTEFKGKNSLDNEIARLEQQLTWKNSDVKNGNRTISQTVEALFRDENLRIKQEHEKIKELINQTGVQYEMVKREPSSEISIQEIDEKDIPKSAATRLEQTGKDYEFDFFICHASEDKESFVRPLAEKLRASQFKVWYDEFTLTLGDSLRKKIDYGLANSCFGIVILSKFFFEKELPQKELDGLVARERKGKKIVLPIWHGVGEKDVEKFSPILAGRLAISTNKGMNKVVLEIIKAFKH